MLIGACASSLADPVLRKIRNKNETRVGKQRKEYSEVNHARRDLEEKKQLLFWLCALVELKSTALLSLRDLSSGVFVMFRVR